MNRIFLFFTSLITLVVFTFTSCYVPLGFEAEKYVIEIGKGTPVFVYLDSHYEPITESISINDPDPGKTALVVLDNPMAEGVMVLAETTSTGTTVSIINSNDRSTINMFFDEGNNFPSSLVINSPGECINAYLSSYSIQKEQYSIVFEDDYSEENLVLNNVIMNKDILNVYTNDSTLSAAQNTRISNIYTSLGVFASLNYALVGVDNSTVFLAWSWWGNLLAVFFAPLAVIAFTVAVVVVPLTALAIVGTAIVIASATVGMLLDPTLLTFVPVIIALSLPKNEEGGDTLSPIGPLVVKIWNNGELINSESVFYREPYNNGALTQNNSIDFEIKFYKRQTVHSNDIQYFLYDPYKKSTLFTDLLSYPAFLSIELNGDKIPFDPNSYSFSDYIPLGKKNHTLRFSRNTLTGDGFDKGYLYFGLSFNRQEVKVNGEEIKNLPLSDFIINGEGDAKIYFIKLTIKKENAVPSVP